MKRKTKRDYYVSCILAAGGSGTRMGAEVNKIFLDVLGVPVIARTLSVLNNSDFIDEIIIVTKEHDLAGCHDIVREFNINKVKTITVGGSTRQESVRNGLFEVSGNADIVMVHDAARPLVTPYHLEEVIFTAKEYGAAALGVPEKNTLKQIDSDGFIVQTVDRSMVYAIHTPQVFAKELIEKMYKYADETSISATDDCMLAEVMGVKIKMIEDSYENIKITTPDDLVIAERILENR
ncbi:MAG: 2-C-methyl-D-erythritol 4-phosphate cytidylyltransferase [Ruminococcaceae bacterium]|nr:2-C-methyl-D-erythritol 4-phosphate cytidylyltransferase [Oscillospiraceae bacterium]